VDQVLVVEDPVFKTKNKKGLVPVSHSRVERNSKQGGRAKPPALGVPKFLQLAEVLRSGGGKRRRKKEERVCLSNGQNNVSLQGSSSFTTGDNDQDGAVDILVPDSQAEGNLEVVLQSENAIPPSGINLLVDVDSGLIATNRGDLQQQHEALKLLEV
ncbi:hypothetical protein A2U01_0032589, partial [Trifolium medium]|nr:hypothetical protein [Trifolium medium]